MKWQELASQECSIARTLAVIGDRWTLMILRDLFLGASRFEEIQRSLNISRTVLAERLNLLETEGVVRRLAYQQKPTRYKYKLTPKGIDLYPVLMALVHWGDQHYATEVGPPVIHHHQRCGHDFSAMLTCSECGEPVSPYETTVRFASEAITAWLPDTDRSGMNRG
ncbi:MAG: helix-turn-helix domain-containing protein [Halioglobus sp.]|nr:helix-turn-helix domain-containing protein [Halioglobus sp.]